MNALPAKSARKAIVNARRGPMRRAAVRATRTVSRIAANRAATVRLNRAANVDVIADRVPRVAVAGRTTVVPAIRVADRKARSRADPDKLSMETSRRW